MNECAAAFMVVQAHLDNLCNALKRNAALGRQFRPHIAPKAEMASRHFSRRFLPR